MHRRYRPILPTHNKLLQQRWDSAYYDEHRRRVASATPTINTRPPETYMHLHIKLKRLQVEEERLAVIERDNRILLTKMANIMKTQGSVDNQNPYEYKSLSREKRLRELLKVSKENEEMVKRISGKKPLYDHAQWDQDWITNQQYMEQIALYPKDWWKSENQSRETSARNNQRSKSAGTTHREKSSTSRPESKASRASAKGKPSSAHHKESKTETSQKEKPDPKSTVTKNEKSTTGQKESAIKY